MYWVLTCTSGRNVSPGSTWLSLVFFWCYLIIFCGVFVVVVCLFVCVRACVHVCVRACVRACVRVCVFALIMFRDGSVLTKKSAWIL